jgi:hypothetical protein
VATALALAVTGSAIGLTVSALREVQALHRQIAERPLGQPVHVASGDGWSLVAWQSDQGLCVDLVVPGNGATGCGIPVIGAAKSTSSGSLNEPLHDVGYLLASGQNGQSDVAIGGVVAPDVAKVQIVLTNGSQIEPQILAAPAGFDTSARFFFAHLPGSPAERGDTSRIESINVYDRDGQLLERLTLGG